MEFPEKLSTNFIFAKLVAPRRRPWFPLR